MAASLNKLVYVESQHHQVGKSGGEMILSVTVIMFKVIAEIFEGVKGFVLDFPTRPTRLHNGPNTVFVYGDIGNPGKGGCFATTGISWTHPWQKANPPQSCMFVIISV
jgi:hypothetical protein